MDPTPEHSPHEATTVVENRKDQATSRDKEKKALKGWRMSSKLLRRFLRFFKEVWKSLLVLVIIDAVTGAIWVVPHAFDRLFPVTYFSTSGDIIWTQFAYPYQQPIFSSLTAALVATMIPIGVILITQIWSQSFCDATSAILGLAYSLVSGTFCIVVLKKTIGGLRPHFLSVCEPVLPLQETGAGYKDIMFTVRQVCTGKDEGKIGNAIESFPSGHSEIAFAGLSYLSLYLFAHLRIQSRCRVGYWRMLACLLPILLATYIASTLVLNYHHHSYDVVFGSLLGIIVALFGYRMAFNSIWNKEKNATPSCHPDCECGKAILPQ